MKQFSDNKNVGESHGVKTKDAKGLGCIIFPMKTYVELSHIHDTHSI